VKKEITLNALYMNSPGQTWAGLWKHPGSRGDFNKLSYWTDLAKLCERGLIDAIFAADGVGVMDVYEGNPAALFRTATTAPSNEPTLLIPAMASVTKNLCFAATSITSYEHPFIIARRYSTLDHLTDGRVAWNVVTGGYQAGALAVGLPGLRDHDLRYDIADEFMEAVYKLWEGSWEDGAVIRDVEAGIYADPAKIHRIVHRSAHIQMEGYFNCSPSPQRTPLIYQAGASPRGKIFAAKHAECLFLVGHHKPYVADQVKSIRQLAVEQRRDANDVKMLLAATAIVAPTDAEAEDLRQDIERTVDIEGVLALYSGFIGEDLSRFDLDEPMENLKLSRGADMSKAMRTIIELMTRSYPDRQVTLRDMGKVIAVPGRDVVFTGSPQTIADQMTGWMDDTDIDGFLLTRTLDPTQLEAFVDLVVPELQSRQRYKTRYAEGTYREKLFGRGAHLPSIHTGAAFRRAER